MTRLTVLRGTIGCMVSSARRGRGRPPGISGRVRRDVYEAVREILMASGYAALRLDDVAAAAGVHKSTLYRQWATKAQLVRDVLNDSAAAHYPRPDEGSWAADIDALCHDLVRLFRSPTTIAFVRTRAVADDPELISGLRDLATADMGFVREPFERAIARGEIDPALSVEILAELAISPFLARVAITRLPVDDAFGKSVAAAMRAIGRPICRSLGQGARSPIGIFGRTTSLHGRAARRRRCAPGSAPSGACRREQ
jgi:AcrR family transcriptional regulator